MDHCFHVLTLLFCAEMGFAKEYEFLTEIGLGPRNLGGYVNGSWKARGPVVSTVNPANNQVLILATSIRATSYPGIRCVYMRV